MNISESGSNYFAKIEIEDLFVNNTVYSQVLNVMLLMNSKTQSQNNSRAIHFSLTHRLFKMLFIIIVNNPFNHFIKDFT